MRAYIKERTLLVANHIAETKDTIRKTAEIYNLSKSTVHNDLAKRLNRLDAKLFDKVKDVLNENFSLKHIRGGESTRQKYLNLEK